MSEPEAAPVALQMRGVTRVFPGDVTALAGVDLTVRRGEMVAVTGPSGCGKSTLLHLLAAIDTPTAGQVTFEGRDLGHLHSLGPYRRWEVGLIFQFHNLLPHLSALANVELPMYGTGHSARQRDERARQLLAEVSLQGCEHRLPTELSGGERQRVAIARALANDPKVLLADEPTGSLDSASTDSFLRLLRALHAGGMTVVIVTHDAAVAEQADRIVDMRDGRIVGEHTPAHAGPPAGAVPGPAPAFTPDPGSGSLVRGS